MSVLKQTGDSCVTERHLSAHALIWGLPGQQTHGPAAFVYLCSTFKNWFLATGLIKTRDILVVLSRHCKVKMKIVSPPYSVKSLYEHFNKTIYSSHLVAIWRSSQKLRKKKPHRFLTAIFQMLLLPPPQNRRKQREWESKSKTQLRNKI